jgi:hypothetical protein
MMAAKLVTRPHAHDAQGGTTRRLPWPILRREDCFHLDLYPLAVLTDDGEEYTLKACPLCGYVEHVDATRHGQRPSRAVLVKAAGEYVDWKNDPRYRWITLKPHGDEGRGYPVLIRMDDPAGEGGTGTIVGGAGGAMNYRRITGVKTRGEYRTEARARREEAAKLKARRRQARMQAGREAGLSEQEIAAKERERTETLQQLKEAEAKLRAEHIGEVREILGWEGVQLDESVKENMPEKSVARIERERERRLLRAAEQVEKQVQDAIISEHDRAVAEAIGTARPEDLTCSEIDDSGLGYVAAVSRLAQENGMSARTARKESRIATNEYLLAAEEEGYIESAARTRNYIDSLQAMAALGRIEDAPFRKQGLHKPDTPMELTPEQARSFVMAREKYKQAQRELEAKRREVEGAAPTDLVKVTAGDALVEIGQMTDEEAMKAVEDSLQARARITAAERLISSIEELQETTGPLDQHVLEGRHVQLEEVTQALFHQPMTMCRETLDLLGAEAGAQLMANVVRQAMSEEEREAAAAGLRQYHIDTQVAKAREAVEIAQQHLEAADHVFDGLGTVGELGPEGLEAASAAQEERLQELQSARELLGVTLGRLQMLGHLNAALMEGTPETIDCALGQVSGAQAFQIAAALGLSPKDYEVQTDGPNKYLRIMPSGWSKLIDRPDPEVAQLYEDVVAIKRGDQDEEGWLAQGLMRRPSDAYYSEADQLHAQGWEADADELLKGKYGADLEDALREYAGRMLANDGIGSAASLRSRVLSAEWQADHLDDMQRAQFAAAVASIFPAAAAEDNWTAVGEELAKPFTEAADAERVALDAQQINTSSAWDPVHRALQEVPEGKVAFTAISAMTPQDKALLRQYFWEHLTDERPPSAAETRREREQQQAAASEVVGTQFNIFGEAEEVTRGETEAFQERAAEAKEAAGDNAWTRYVRAQRGVGNAYATIQALIQGDLVESFARHYGRETGRALRTAPAEVPNGLRHLIGLMPQETLDQVLDADNGTLRQMYESLRRRDAQGRYAAGEVANLAQRILEKAKRMQLPLFAEAPPSTQRVSIGRAAEAQLRRAWSRVAPNFDPNNPVEIIEDLTQSGRFVHQQRGVRAIERARRMGLHYSTGSGKSLVAISAFTDLHAQGEVRRGLFIVPPKIQAQFGGEMNRYVEPGRFRHFADPSADADERRAAYADPERQMVAVSHQAWRDDVTWAVAQDRFEGDEAQAATWLRSTSRAEATEAVQAAVKAQGWRFDYQMVDEGHDTLNRRGKPDSRLARVIDATTATAPYFVTATATPVKNDVSEVYDLLHKVRPDKYPEDGFEAFRRRYGLNTEANREALQRLVAPYFYALEVNTGVEEHHEYLPVQLSPAQQTAYGDVLQAYNAARRAPEGSDARREAIARMVPEEALKGLSPEQRARKLDDLGRSLGFTRDRAIARILEHTPPEHNPRIQKVIEIAKRHRNADDDGGQVPGLVFAQSLESVRLIADELKKHGFRVGVITGELSGEDTELRRMGFNADAGRGSGDLAEEAATRRKMAQYDIIVGSGAAGTGLNMERARWLVHYDLPWTAKEIAQRNGRQNRMNQRWGTVAVYTLGTDVPYERRRRDLIDRKRGLMTTFMEPTEQLDDTGLARSIREARAERLSNATHEAVGAKPRSARVREAAAALPEAAT